MSSRIGLAMYEYLRTCEKLESLALEMRKVITPVDFRGS